MLSACSKCCRNNNYLHQEDHKTEQSGALFSLQQNALSAGTPLTVQTTHLLHSMQITAGIPKHYVTHDISSSEKLLYVAK